MHMMTPRSDLMAEEMEKEWNGATSNLDAISCAHARVLLKTPFGPPIRIPRSDFQ
jgi:hypothetical protein